MTWSRDFTHLIPLTRAQLVGGLNTPPPPEVFFAIAKKRRRFLHSCSDNCSTTFLKILRNVQDLVYYQVPTTCISRIFFYIGDLRSGQFGDLPIISQCGKKLKCLKYLSDLFKSFRIMLNSATVENLGATLHM